MDGLFGGCGDIYFWQRSRAWSEEWSEDDEIDEGTIRNTQEAARNHLTVPDLSSSAPRREGFLSTTGSTIHEKSTAPSLRCTSRSRKRIFQHRRTVSLDIFGKTSPTKNNTAEIFWEEKILDADDLEALASRLCI
jgi:hypothetical protein